MEIITVEFLMNPSSACAIRQRCTEQDFQAEILGRAALSTPAEAPLEAVPAGEAPSSTSRCLGGTATTSTAWEAASSSRSKGVSVADVGVKAATGGCNGDNLQTSRGDTYKHLVPCDASIKEDIALLLGKGFKGTEEIAGDKGIREIFEDPLDAAEAVAEEAQGASVAVEPMASQDEESLEGQSPFGTTHLSETSTVALSPSDSLLRDAQSMDHVFIIYIAIITVCTLRYLCNFLDHVQAPGLENQCIGRRFILERSDRGGKLNSFIFWFKFFSLYMSCCTHLLQLDPSRCSQRANESATFLGTSS